MGEAVKHCRGLETLIRESVRELNLLDLVPPLKDWPDIQVRTPKSNKWANRTETQSGQQILTLTSTILIQASHKFKKSLNPASKARGSSPPLIPPPLIPPPLSFPPPLSTPPPPCPNMTSSPPKPVKPYSRPRSELGLFPGIRA
ncbi:hypothetical protein AAMO2058_001643300 [Amorphochlora amoebiformis]